jgi:hypothetical protein
MPAANHLATTVQGKQLWPCAFGLMVQSEGQYSTHSVLSTLSYHMPDQDMGYVPVNDNPNPVLVYHTFCQSCYFLSQNSS